jgi:iron complex transport system substrate-binding protein
VRIVSLLPAATETILALGLGSELVGVTHRCDVPSTDDEPVVLTEAGPERDILDEEALLDTTPDLVIAGDGEDGGIDARSIERLFDEEEVVPSVLRIAPSSVEGVFNAIVAIGAMTEAEDEALGIVVGLRERLKCVEDIILARRDGGFVPPRAVLLAGLEPPLGVGRWIPDQVRLAGGWELLGHEGERARPTTWDAVRDLDPEVLVLLPGGLPLPEAVRAFESTPRPEGWDELRAVQGGRVFVVDGEPFVLPGPRVMDGVEVLTELFDPAAFDGMSPVDTWIRVH